VVTIFIAPYLDVPDAGLGIGPWHAIPARSFRPEHASSPLAFEQALGLLEIYRKSKRVDLDAFGVFFRRGQRLVG
jgi:hypothetical protein